jgi:hypothetical protein
VAGDVAQTGQAGMDGILREIGITVNSNGLSRMQTDTPEEGVLEY